MSQNKSRFQEGGHEGSSVALISKGLMRSWKVLEDNSGRINLKLMLRTNLQSLIADTNLCPSTDVIGSRLLSEYVNEKSNDDQIYTNF